MNKKSDQLDHIVKDKLNQLHVEYKPQHWAQFEEMLDQQEAGVPVVEDRHLDAVVFEKMHQLKVGERAAHWNKLAVRMADQVDVSQKLVLYKLMEASLLLLLLFIVAQNFPLNSINSASSSDPVALQNDLNSSIQNKDNITAKTPNPSAFNKTQGLATKKLPKDLKPTIDIAQLRLFEQNATLTQAAAQTILPTSEPYLVSPNLPKSTLKIPASKTGKPS